MKNLIFLVAVSLIFFPSCKEKDGWCSEVKIPKNLSPIDWENYNDVYTVYWNCMKKQEKHNNKGDTIKVYGWIFQGHHGHPVRTEEFSLIDKEANIFAPNRSVENGVYISVECYSIADSLKNKFSTLDITKKCYITGALRINGIIGQCEPVVPIIKVTDINNINFE